MEIISFYIFRVPFEHTFTIKIIEMNWKMNEGKKINIKRVTNNSTTTTTKKVEKLQDILRKCVNKYDEFDGKNGTWRTEHFPRRLSTIWKIFFLSSQLLWYYLKQSWILRRRTLFASPTIESIDFCYFRSNETMWNLYQRRTNQSNTLKCLSGTLREYSPIQYATR